MTKQTIVVLGSTNTDMVIKTTKLPKPGETILGGDFLMNPGGKGANQAVAAARLNGHVTLVAKTGEDLFGSQAMKLFQDEKVNTDFLFTDPESPSGIALITVDEHAENCIVVAPGANARLLRADVEKAANAINAAEIILMQLEIPLDTVCYAAEIAFNAGKKVILNPAPAQPLPDELIKMLYLITPNETEAELLTGVPVTDVKSAESAARRLLAKGVQVVVVTLGSRGALLVTADQCHLIPSFKVKAVDTTAAGDCFNGALAVAIAEGAGLENAIAFANKAASISVTRMGAQVSAPYRDEVL
ncbi:MAG: ribokinase [Prolixibacteraceae bacterium]|jgi:ribokinase|nr:ribokinase [Prolixibacteraceae bacterium]